MFRSLFYMSSTLLTLLVALQTASAQTQSARDYGYISWIECSDGYGGAVSWKGYPLNNAEQEAKYPRSALDNVHVHVLKGKADVERDGLQAHDRAVRLCAAKIAMFTRPKKKDILSTLDMSEDLRRSLNPTDTGRIIVFDDQDRIIGVSEVLDMRRVGGLYAQHLMRQQSER